MGPHRPPLWHVGLAAVVVVSVLLAVETLVPYRIPFDQAAHSLTGAATHSISDNGSFLTQTSQEVWFGCSVASAEGSYT